MNLSRILLMAILLTRLLPTNPLEFRDRLQAFAARAMRTRRTQSQPVTDAPRWIRAVDELGHLHCDAEVTAILGEPRFRDTLSSVEDRIASLGEGMPFHPEHNADPALYSLCYLMTRLLQPDVVVESGVAHGVTSTMILAALAENGRGVLHSIDLPPLVPAADDHVGCLIPDDLRAAWTLHRGTTVRLLPKLTRTLPPIGLFIHDSLFTLQNTSRELELAFRHLAPRSGLIVNSVQCSPAFDRWVARHSPDWSLVVSAERKLDQIGLALFQPEQPANENGPTRQLRDLTRHASDQWFSFPDSDNQMPGISSCSS